MVSRKGTRKRNYTDSSNEPVSILREMGNLSVKVASAYKQGGFYHAEIAAGWETTSGLREITANTKEGLFEKLEGVYRMELNKEPESMNLYETNEVNQIEEPKENGENKNQITEPKAEPIITTQDSTEKKNHELEQEIERLRAKLKAKDAQIQAMQERRTAKFSISCKPSIKKLVDGQRGKKSVNDWFELAARELEQQNWKI